MAEHHYERRELNLRARALLVADGELTGPELHVAGVVFQAGDEVIARAKDKHAAAPTAATGAGRHQRPAGPCDRGPARHRRQPGAEPGRGLRAPGSGRGPHAALTRHLRAGVTGVLAHSYALTSHAAEGETYEAGRHLATERSSRPGVYVGLSRGRTDVGLYMVRKSDISPPIDEHPNLPRLTNESTLLEAVTARLEAERAERLASEIDPDAAEVGRLRHSLSVRDLAARSLSPTTPDHLAGPRLGAGAGGHRLRRPAPS